MAGIPDHFPVCGLTALTKILVLGPARLLPESVADQVSSLNLEHVSPAGMMRLEHLDGQSFLLERLLDFRIAKLARACERRRIFYAHDHCHHLHGPALGLQGQSLKAL